MCSVLWLLFKEKIMYVQLLFCLSVALFGVMELDASKGLQQTGAVKLYAFYTPSHEKFSREWFLPSLDKEYELILECFDQECPSATIMHAGWKSVMLHKLDMILRGIKENWGEVFVHSDVDIQFFGQTKDVVLALMEGKDLVIQRDDPFGQVCTGFLACRGNERTLRLFEEIQRKVLEPNNNMHEQDWLNQLIYLSNPFNIVWDYLPSEQFMGGGTYTGKLWTPGKDLPVPPTLLMHHANYTFGPANKFEELKYVRAKKQSMQASI